MTEHFIFTEGRLSYPCAGKCGSWDATHSIGLAFWCAACCPQCSASAPVERVGPVVGLSGEQLELVESKSESKSKVSENV